MVLQKKISLELLRGIMMCLSKGLSCQRPGEATRIKKEGLDVRLVEVDDLLHGQFKV